jgi:SAM-dependent methyltransferase
MAISRTARIGAASQSIDRHIVRYRGSVGAVRILDLGCGDGERAITLATRPSNRVTGLDSSEMLLSIARRQAARRKLAVEFLHGNPYETHFPQEAFDEVLILGGLFGSGSTSRADIELLLEGQRILRPGGALRLAFPDGEWLRIHFQADSVEPLINGFIYRRRTLREDGHCLRTEVIGADQEAGLLTQQTALEWLYTAREVTELLHRLGFESIAYDASLSRLYSENRLHPVRPHHVVRCTSPRRRYKSQRMTIS